MDWHYNGEQPIDYDYVTWRLYLYEMLIVSGVLPAVVVLPMLMFYVWVGEYTYKGLDSRRVDTDSVFSILLLKCVK